MNDNKICFIMCTNNTQYASEFKRYLNALIIPKDYHIEFLEILDACSMTAGYNEGMNATDAKYKIYLHQDVFIINKNFIIDILNFFKDSAIGMIGMVGCEELPKTGVMWYGKRVGNIYSNHICNSYISDFSTFEGEYCEVKAIDGLMIITQYDLPWRDDLFKSWDYYDISQSHEFINAGYKIIVPNTKTPWCIHDDGMMKLNNYYSNREIFLKAYLPNREISR